MEDESEILFCFEINFDWLVIEIFCGSKVKKIHPFDLG